MSFNRTDSIFLPGIHHEDNQPIHLVLNDNKITIKNLIPNNWDKGINFFYVHSSLEKNIGKIVSIVKLDNIIKGKNDLKTIHKL